MNNINQSATVLEPSSPLSTSFSGEIIESIKGKLEGITDALIASLPDAEQLTPSGRRGIIARYSVVLEGNFIYWMTGAYLASRSEEARSIILNNLHEEVRDCHPGMMRRFALAAHSSPTDDDARAVYANLTSVRLFIGKLSGQPILATMAFFEGFIQRFMPYLAELATFQGSSETEYTDVHGVCDITHSQELYGALAAEIALSPSAVASEEQMFEGVHLLEKLIQTIVLSSQDS